ncbi:MAG: MFS transporter [Rhodospirillales bacterium]|nr:MFS transporter [Rhodospirillales bacterium]
MSPISARLSFGFACAAHSFSHLFAPMFFVVALALESELGLSHGDVITLVIAGSLMFGLGAPLAGWLGDRWSMTGMMVIFFLGTGAAMAMTGTATTPLGIALWLAVTGTFASIYHPVGIAWVVRNAVNRGMAVGVNGIFGGFGIGSATMIAGALTEFAGWRWAFIVPGVVVAATGLVFWALLAKGDIVEPKVDRAPEAPTGRSDMVRAFVLLSFTMICVSLVENSTLPAMPKLFTERWAPEGEGVFGISVIIGTIFLIAGFMQLAGGYLVDRVAPKIVYATCFLLQIAFLSAAATFTGVPFIAVIAGMVFVNIAVLPAEAVLVARYSPSRWRGLAFGLKFVLSIGLSSLGVLLEGTIYNHTGGFYWLFMLLAGLSALGFLLSLLLPAKRAEAQVPAAAE